MSITNKPSSVPTFGENQGIWEYYDVNDQFLGYVVRHETNTGKRFKPWTFQDGKWIGKWWSSDTGSKHKPIYRAQYITKEPSKPILIVEGEKAADKAQSLLPKYTVISWMGGAKSVKKVDWSALAGRKVYAWPDNDETGMHAMNEIFKLLKGVASSLHPVQVDKLGLPAKWDLGDFDNGQDVLDSFMIEMTIDGTAAAEDVFDPSGYPVLSDNPKNPRPLDVRENLEYLLDHFNIDVRYNQMRRVREVDAPGEEFFIEEEENASLHYITDLAIKNGFPYKRIDQHLDAIAWRNAYHPITDWILKGQPSETPLLDQFIGLLKTTNPELSKVLIRKWMISAVESVFSKRGFSAQGVLVIQGAQGTHKTTFVESLVDPLLNAVKTGQLLDPSNKDSVLESSNYWIVELGELDATFRKADIARLKAHITKSQDELRRAYARKSSHMARRTVFVATVNESRFFVDETGNRRWWVISLTEAINTRHGLDMQAIWREVYELWLNGETSQLDKDTFDALNESNQQYLFADPFEEKVDVSYYWDRSPCRWMNATEILEEIGYERPNKSDLKRMGDVLAKRNLQKGTGRRRYSYYMPQRKPYPVMENDQRD